MFDYDISSKMNVLAWVNFIVGLIISAVVIIVCVNTGGAFIWIGIIGGDSVCLKLWLFRL